MKLIMSGILIPAIFSLNSCSENNTCVQYIAGQNEKSSFEFKYEEADSSTQTISMISYPKGKESEKPLFFQFKYSGQKKYAEKLKAITVKFYTKEENSNDFTKEIISNKTFTSTKTNLYYYFDDPSRETDFKGNLCDLINKKDDQNNEKTINYFYIDEEFNITEFPKEIKIVITVKWEGGEKEFVTVLQYGEVYCTSNVRTNPFG